jgi:AAA family ATP:ADP antiporter
MLIINYIDKRERRRNEAHLPLDETTAMMTATRAVQVERAQDMLLNFTGEPDSGSSRTNDDGEGETELAGDGKGAFALVLGTRYLLMIGMLTMLLNFVNTTGGYVMDRLVVETASEIASGPADALSQAEFMTAYYGSFYSLVNLIGLLTQLFLVSRIVKYLGVGIGLMILPIISLGAYGLITFVPVLAYVRWAKTAENATDYSLNNTVRNMLFLPTTREQKYKAKQVVDSLLNGPATRCRPSWC